MELQASKKATHIQELIVAFFRDSSEPNSNHEYDQAHRTGLQASEGDGNMKNYKSVASNENELFYLSTLLREPRIARSNLFIASFPREQPNANLKLTVDSYPREQKNARSKLIVVFNPVQLPPDRTPVSEGEQVDDHLFARSKFASLPRELSIPQSKLIVDLFFKRAKCFKAPICCPPKCPALCEVGGPGLIRLKFQSARIFFNFAPLTDPIDLITPQKNHKKNDPFMTDGRLKVAHFFWQILAV